MKINEQKVTTETKQKNCSIKSKATQKKVQFKTQIK